MIAWKISPARLVLIQRGIIWAVIFALLFYLGYQQQVQVMTWPHLSAPLVPDDSDVWLRLHQVRQWIAGGSFFDHSIPRTNAPFGGITVPWTRPLDIVISALYHLTPSALPMNMRLMLAATWLPMGLAFIIIAFISAAAYRRMRHTHTLFCAAFLAILSPLKSNYLMAGNADHHGMLCALWCGVLYIIMGELGYAAAGLAGVLLGVMFWISIEAFIPIALVLSVLGILTLTVPEKMKALALMTGGIFLVTAAALFVEMPIGKVLRQTTYDSLSIVQVTLLGLVAAHAAGLAFFFNKLRGVKERVLAVIISAVSTAGIMWFLYPKFYAGPLVDMAPYITTHFLSNIGEMSPLSRLPVFEAVKTLAAPALALVVASLSLHRHMNVKKKRQFFILLTFFGVTLFLTIFHVRMTYYLQPVAILLAAGALPGLCRARRHEFFQYLKPLPPLLRCAIPILLLPAAVFIASRLSNQGTSINMAASTCMAQSEYVIETQQLEKLLDKKPMIFLTERDLGGWMQFFTSDAVIAQNYFREGAGMAALASMTKKTSAERARSLLKKRQVSAIFVCPASYPTNSWVYKLKNPADRPAWLKPVTGLQFSEHGEDTPLLFVAYP